MLILLIMLLLLTSGEATNADVLAPDPSFSETTLPPYTSCFTEATTWSSQESSDFITGVEDLYSCQSLCLNSDTCHHFTWFTEEAAPFNLACFLFDDPSEEYPCSNCISGPKTCTCSGTYSCQFTSENFLGDKPHVETELRCQDLCFKTDQCNFYSWFQEDVFPKLCLFFNSCDEKENCETCHSGPLDCGNVAIMTSTTTTPPPPTTAPTTTTPTTSTAPTTTTSTTTTAPLTTTTKPHLSCYDSETTWSSNDITSTFPNVYSATSCQAHCQNNTDSCTYFTWYSPAATPLHNTCTLFLDPSSSITCSNCISGPMTCLCGDNFACEMEDNLVDVIAPIQNEMLCQEACYQSPLCNFYTYFNIHAHPFNETCVLFSSCEKTDFSCEGCSSGPDDCRNISYITTLHPTSPPTTTTTLPTTTTPFMSTTTLHPYTSCFSLSTSFPHEDLIVPPLPAYDAYGCQRQCVNSTRCTDFTFYPHNQVCLLFESPTNVTEDHWNCWSGPKHCTCSFPVSCITEGDNFIDVVTDMLEEDWCRQLCYQNVLCRAYTWFNNTTGINKNWCYLFSTCQEMDQTCQGCFTGPPIKPQHTCQFKSCREIKNANPWIGLGDGIYTIYPDGNEQSPVEVFCEMTTNGGGWTVMAYLRSQEQWDYTIFSDHGEVGDVAGGFSTGATLKNINAKFTEKLIVYLQLEELDQMLGRQWMINQRPDALSFSEINTRHGWSYKDSFGYKKVDAGNICSDAHGCSKYRGFGIFRNSGGWCGTQGGDYGCRDGNNICWQPRGLGLGCNVGDKRCALLSGDGEGVIYAVR